MASGDLARAARLCATATMLFQAAPIETSAAPRPSNRPSSAAPEIVSRAKCTQCGKTLETTIRGFSWISCARCDRTIDYWVLDPLGIPRRPPWFFSGVEFPSGEKTSNQDGAWAAIATAWTVLGRSVRYRSDAKVHFGQSEAWQPSFITWLLKTGDCEDTAILLADWLRSAPCTARAVAGDHLGSGHAWVVCWDKSSQFLIESTAPGPSRRVPPYASLLGAMYAPRLQFDARTVWFRNPESPLRPCFDYRSPDGWFALQPQ